MIKGKLRAHRNPEIRDWYAVEYEIPAENQPEPPRAQELPGLIFLHYLDAPGLAEGGASSRFIAYWQTREDYEASRGPLEGRLGKAVLRRAAWVRRTDVRKEPFWKRFTLYGYGVLVHVVALLAALAALEKHYDWLLEEPRVALDVSENGPIHLSQGLPLNTRLILTNQRANVVAEISALEVRLRGPAGSHLLPTGSALSIRERDTLELPIESPVLKPGIYQLEARGLGRSGRLRGWRPLAVSREVRVWSRAPQIQFSLEPRGASRRKLKALLQVGEDAPEGLDCQATLTDEPAVRFGPIEFPNLSTWPDPDVSREGLVSIQTWLTPPQDKFSDISFSLYLEGRPSQDWSQMPRHIAMECSQRTGKEQR